MKKLYIVIIGLVICAIGIVVFFKFKNNSLDETLKEAKSMSSYQLVCDMEMTQNDELKSYEVKVDYLKKEVRGIFYNNTCDFFFCVEIKKVELYSCGCRSPPFNLKIKNSN